MIDKNALRAGAVSACAALMLLMPCSAFASDGGTDPGPGLSVAQTLGLYVAIPLVLFGVIAGLVVATDKSRKK